MQFNRGSPVCARDGHKGIQCLRPTAGHTAVRHVRARHRSRRRGRGRGACRILCVAPALLPFRRARPQRPAPRSFNRDHGRHVGRREAPHGLPRVANPLEEVAEEPLDSSGVEEGKECEREVRNFLPDELSVQVFERDGAGLGGVASHEPGQCTAARAQGSDENVGLIRRESGTASEGRELMCICICRHTGHRRVARGANDTSPRKERGSC